MRRLLSVALVLVAGCEADIVPGTYLCGPEQACPQDQACNGTDNICVLASAAKPFACGAVTEVEPNDGFAAGQLLDNLTCVSRPIEVLGCEQDVDGEDWFRFVAPANCASGVAASARLTFPIAYEPLALELRASDGSVLGTSTECANEPADDGDDRQCLDVTLTAGSTYAVRIARTATATCGGTCSYNRYRLSFQLTTP